jgi:PAS domain S-box-containing protein
VDKISDEILSLLETSEKYLTISEISKNLNHGRQTIARHLDNLLHWGRISMVHHGLKKKYYISKVRPEGAIKNFSGHIQLILNKEFTVISVNDDFLNWMQSDKVSVVGKKIGPIFKGIFNLETFFNKIHSLSEGQSCQFEDIIRIQEKTFTFTFTISRFILRKNESYIFLSGENISHKKKLEQDLFKSEDRLRTLTQNIPGMVFRLNIRNKNFDYCSQFFEITGYFLEINFSYTFHPLEAYIHPEDIEQVKNKIFSVMNTGKKYEIEYRIFDPIGTLIYLLERGQPVFDTLGILEFLDGIIFDISDRKRSEEKIKQNNKLLISLNNELIEADNQFRQTNEELLFIQQELLERKKNYQFLFNSAPIGIGITNFDGEMVVANSYMQNLIGYSPDEFSSYQLKWSFVNPDERKIMLKTIKNEGRLRNFEVELRRKGGKQYVALMNCDLIVWKDKPAIFITCRDITHRKKTEEELRKKQEKYQLLVENISDVVWIVDPETWFFTYISPSVEKLLGYSVEEILSKSVDFAFTYADSSHIRKKFQERIKLFIKSDGKQNCYLDEFEQLCKGGLFVWIEVITHLYINRDTGKLEIVGVTRDISQRKKLELQNSIQKKRLELSQRISHIASWEYNIQTKLIWGSEELFRILRINPPSNGLFSFQLIKSCIPEYSKFIEPVMQLIKNNIPVNEITTINPADGSSPRTVFVIIERDDDKTKDSKTISGVVQDITEWKLAEEKYIKTEEKYQKLFETIEQGIVYHDINGKGISANPVSERILGLTQDQLCGICPLDPDWRAIHPDGTEYSPENHPLIITLQTGKEIRNELMGVFHPGSQECQWIYIDTFLQKLPGEKKPSLVFSVFTDLTHLKIA